MLELKEIKKVYPTGNEEVKALRGIDLQFRKSEFVSILGPSGCGKTTMLNIIGGLDQYTSGDLLINGVSTKNYKNRDWDTYRNHSVGFVFQSYNLIPHQTVLQNVELALTLSGVSKSKRRKMAIEALGKVGLSDQLKKKPGEMSGGQMQRVAIARAIVNDPDIILADEPTGALDTETSVQVMEILKEIAKDRLVVMVTHNPELAEKYSTRIVRMLDGKIIGDSKPLTKQEVEQEVIEQKQKEVEKTRMKRKKKPSMSFGTSFGLSLRNLFTKKGRTLLVSFAGSIGIIGIALIYAVSNGMTGYINAVQEETLTSYPLVIEEKSLDLTSLISSFLGEAKAGEKHKKNAVYQKNMLYNLIQSLSSVKETENDLTSFKAYIDQERKNPESAFKNALSGLQYTYPLNPVIYTKNVDGEILESNTETLITEIMKKYAHVDFSSMLELRDQNPLMSSSSGSSPMSRSSSLWRELVPGEKGKLVNRVTEKQYDLLYGSWPTRYDEIVLFTDENNELGDLTLYALGLKPEKEIKEMFNEHQKDQKKKLQKWSYEEICDKTFRTVLPSDCYTLDKVTGTYKDLRETSAGMRYLYDNGLDLHVVGIARPNEDAVSNKENGSIGYTKKLTEYIIKESSKTEAVKAQKKNRNMDIFTGLPFKANSDQLSKKEKMQYFKEYAAGLSAPEKAELFVKIKSIPEKAAVKQFVSQTLGGISRETMEAQMTEVLTKQMGMDEQEVAGYVSDMSKKEIREMFATVLEEQYKAQFAAEVQTSMSQMPPEQLVLGLDELLNQANQKTIAGWYDSVLEFSENTYEDNLIELGCIDMKSPSSISLYPSSFENKDKLEAAIQTYNDSVKKSKRIQYTDYVGLIMSSVTTIIDAITYVLIAFVAVSLFVSSIMIGVITLISVQERTKEIGILRAIGASKRNVSGMFNAETLIIGFTSGLLGVLITYVLCIPINAVIHRLTDINNLNASLQPQVAIVLILISMLLNLIAGLVPSRSAAKKDPVVALRSE